MRGLTSFLRALAAALLSKVRGLRATSGSPQLEHGASTSEKSGDATGSSKIDAEGAADATQSAPESAEPQVGNSKDTGAPSRSVLPSDAGPALLDTNGPVVLDSSAGARDSLPTSGPTIFGDVSNTEQRAGETATTQSSIEVNSGSLPQAAGEGVVVATRKSVAQRADAEASDQFARTSLAHDSEIAATAVLEVGVCQSPSTAPNVLDHQASTAALPRAEAQPAVYPREEATTGDRDANSLGSQSVRAAETRDEATHAGPEANELPAVAIDEDREKDPARVVPLAHAVIAGASPDDDRDAERGPGLLDGGGLILPVPSLATTAFDARNFDEKGVGTVPPCAALGVQDAAEFGAVGRGAKARPLREPRQYRPKPRAPSVVRGGGTPVGEALDRGNRALRIELRLRLEHGGFCRFSLLPRRDTTLPDVLTVGDRDTSVPLIALQDAWYQDVEREDLGPRLRRGIEWEGQDANGDVIRWSLSGREVFVLGQNDQLSGFVTTPRLVLGERHAVLCVSERTDEIRARLQASGCPAPIYFDEALGAPRGWVGFRDVIPKVPVKPSADGDILDVLCPQPDFEIALTGGIPLERSVWLAGFPPRIRLRGDAAAAGEVRVDGQVAAIDPDDGAYVVEHWDRPGDHQVWSAGKSASYSVAFGAEQWEPWDAYRWSFGELAPADMAERPAVCGVLALPPLSSQYEGSQFSRRGLVIAASNPVCQLPKKF